MLAKRNFGQPAPAAADFKKAIASFQFQPAKQCLNFAMLRVFERFCVLYRLGE